MRVITALLVSFAASAFSYKLLTPGDTNGWTSTGPQTVTWQRVKTDPAKFNLALVNDDTEAMPTPKVIATNVDGTQGKTTINAPDGGWPATGDGYRINMVQEDDSILAQSQKFTIKQGVKSVSLASATSTTSSKQVDNGATSSSTAQPTDETDESMPTSQSNDGGAMSIHVEVLAVTLLAIFFLV